MGKPFDAMDVARLLDDLRSAATPASTEPAGMVPVAKAAEKAKIRAVDVLHLILGGHLGDVVRVEGLDGVAALRVDPDRVKRLAALMMDDLSPAAAFGALRIPVRSGWALIDGLGDGVRLPHRSVMGPNGRHAFVRVRQADVDAFAAEFTTVVRIAGALGRPPREIAAIVKAERVRCVATRRHLGVDLIRRADQPPALAA